ncbi:MAG TPA: protein-glutamate O-methyltransferase CheR [Solirubrobacteraceae bacterium]|nr:protein-glutamate O-methyltransferase CheR [Solirubrobacteraceae bacterium]
MTERQTRTVQRTGIARHRGHDAALEGPKSDLAAADDYVAFCEGLRQLCGIDLAQYKRPQMERRLRSFFARQGYARLTDALARLRSDKQQLEELLDRVTINVSQLWRHPDQWMRLEAGLLEGLAVHGRIRAWSAGCSYGAEAYTLAAVCRQVIPGATVRILGTDIDQRMVARAKVGTFSVEDARTAPPATMERWFERTETGWQAKPELRAMTRFEVGDLLKLQPPASSYELIMCRNTVIYFADQIRDELHARLAHALRPGGVLVIGGTERISDAAGLGLSTIHPFIYRKS